LFACFSSLKQLLLSFEKKITKNQKMRMKFADEPEKFMDSEIELHSIIEELYAVAASPELYPDLVHTGAVTSILGCLTHENTDVSIASVGLLQEMTEVDTIVDQLDDAMVFIDALVASQGLELLVQNLSRLDDQANPEDAQGVQNTLAIIENLVEINPEIADTICTKTHILKFLLERCQAKAFDANKLYCSEIFSILLQASELVPTRLCTLEGFNGMEALLQSIALYRKKEVTIADEQV
jgi:beta-catenin-like protein 1